MVGYNGETKMIIDYSSLTDEEIRRTNRGWLYIDNGNENTAYSISLKFVSYIGNLDNHRDDNNDCVTNLSFWLGIAAEDL